MTDSPTGIDLCRQFYQRAVRPILDEEFPRLSHSAGLLGPGSEVLGFDDGMSTDHDWGPRVQIFVHDDAPAEIEFRLRQKIPATFGGYATGFDGPDRSRPGAVIVEEVQQFFRRYLEVDVRSDISPARWLSLPQQKLRTTAAGPLFHDGAGLDALRQRVAWYPHDVWLYILAAGWAQLGEDEHLMGRAGFVGDELGSMLIAARLTAGAMRLCFLMEREYAPYAKWFGTAFGQLECAADMRPLLERVMQVQTWSERTLALARVYGTLARQHNALHLTPALSPETRDFFGRPFATIGGQRFADALLREIRDPVIRAMPPIGAVDQWTDSTVILAQPGWRGALRGLYTRAAAPGDPAT